MDIHKPKPIHSWRELLKEVGTIVLGVCIALGAEQAVEYFHWRHEVELGRKAIAGEIATHNEWYRFRIAIAPCIDRRMDEAQAILLALENKERPNGFTAFHSHGAGAPLSASEWESERASQALVHFPRQELALMSQYYAQIPTFRDWMGEEAATWSKMSGLRNLPAGLTASDMLRLRGDLDRARSIEFLILGNAQRNLRFAGQLGISGGAPEHGQVEAFCSKGD
ncbi:MAG: hypothetical protein H0U98_18515 [Alphaproteobacteria bacterium]|nr:hypothetical protein [Alphaproteobacteria bacterium]